LTTTTVSTITPCVMTTTDGGMPSRCSDGPARSRNANRTAATAMPAGELRPSSATGDAGEAEAGGERVAVQVRLAEHLRQPDEPGQRARQQHRLHDHPLGRDAAGRPPR
jgi:hypothetical protein